jgi:hypothetical protein
MKRLTYPTAKVMSGRVCVRYRRPPTMLLKFVASTFAAVLSLDSFSLSSVGAYTPLQPLMPPRSRSFFAYALWHRVIPRLSCSTSIPR